MFRLIVKYRGSIIIERKLDIRIGENVADWIINLYESELGIDVGEYNIHEVEYSADYVSINIRPKDLQKLRSIKINEILDGY